jgi:hypothetical protein
VSLTEDSDLVVDTFLRGFSTTTPGRPHGVTP